MCNTQTVGYSRACVDCQFTGNTIAADSYVCHEDNGTAGQRWQTHKSSHHVNAHTNRDVFNPRFIYTHTKTFNLENWNVLDPFTPT